MAEYIAKGQVIEWFRPYGHTDKGIPYFGLVTDIREMKAADVAPVVRCKDCKWFADNNDGEWFDCWLFQTIQIIPEDAPKPDDFCSRGERIEEVRNGQV